MTNLRRNIRAAILPAEESQLACHVLNMRKQRRSGGSPFRSVERRLSKRYPITLEARCKVIRTNYIIFGETQDISSGGICLAVARG